MRQLQLVAHGKPSDVIELNTVSELALGQEEVLVSMEAAPLNPSDFFAAACGASTGSMPSFSDLIEYLLKSDPTFRRYAIEVEQNKPILYVENDHLDKSYDLIEYLLKSDYRLFWHLSEMYNPKNYAGVADNIFPNAGAVNMLGIHKDVPLNISGLKEITAPDQLIPPP